jgi:hypothetical protein
MTSTAIEPRQDVPAPTGGRRGNDGSRPDAVSVVVGLAAAFAPASLTGMPVVDAIERALLAGFVTWIGSHGRRWAWLAAGAMVTIPARGVSLGLALLGLAVVALTAIPKRRNRLHGAVGLGLLANAVFWYPPSAVPLGPALAVAAAALVVVSGFNHMRRGKRRAVRIGLWAAAAFVALALGGTLAALALSFNSVQTGSNAAEAALESARNGEAEQAELELADAGDAFSRASSTLGGPLTMPASAIPGLAQQLEAVQVTVDEGRNITDAGDDIIATADYESLQYEGRLDLGQVERLQEPTTAARDVLEDAGVRVEELQTGSLLPPLRTQVEKFAEQIADARQTTAMAADLLEITPGLFGADGDRRYLVLFLTPAELRGAGGFVGNFAELTAKSGDVELTRSGRIGELIFSAPPNTRTISGPADYLDRYGRFRPWDFQQDSTLSPDFPSVAQVMTELYPQSSGQPVDGMIGLDPQGLAALLEFTGPITVDGLDTPLNSENAVEVLTKGQYIDVPNEARRAQILTDAVGETFEKLVSSTLPAPRALADTLSPVARSGHLRVWSPDEREQASFERLGADGTLALPEGDDGFSLVQQNNANNKLDAYLTRTLDYRAEVDAASGELTATLRVELRNNVPSLELPPAVVGNNRGAPQGTNIGWFTLYTRHALTAASIDGEPVDLAPADERGLFAYDTPLVRIPKGGRVVLEFELAGGVDLSDGYHLRVLPQPVANPDVLTASVEVANGATPRGRRATLASDQRLGPPLDLEVPIER